MIIVNDIEEIQRPEPTSLALGNFDGIHIGHLKVIEAANSLIKDKRDIRRAVFTFKENPHKSPAVVTREDKEKIMEEHGVELLFSVDFSQVKDVAAEVFFKEILLKKCNARAVCCGEDFKFGYRAAGDVELLKRLCSESGVVLKVVPEVNYKGARVSSTRIREAIRAGNMEEANHMLGRPFGFALEVIHGNHIGRGLGTPTINQALPEDFILPKFGVYASVVQMDGDMYYGVTNIGVKPTVGSDKVLSETWIPEFSGDLYGKKVRVWIHHFIREERKFASLEEMKAEILKNARSAREFFELKIEN